MFWTEEKLNKVAALRQNGLGWGDIAERLCCGARSAEVQFWRFRKDRGLTKVDVHWTKTEDDKLWEARVLHGKRWKEISDLVGRSANACARRMERLRVERGKEHAVSNRNSAGPDISGDCRVGCN